MLVRTAGDFKAAMDDIRKGLLSLVEEGPTKPVRKKHSGDPGTYGGQFVAMVVYRLTTSNEPRNHGRVDLPGSVDFALEFIAPSLTPQGAGKWRSGRQEAEEKCETAFSEWLKGLANDPRLGGKLERLAVVADEAGDVDRLGNARSDLTTNQILWVLRATVRATL